MKQTPPTGSVAAYCATVIWLKQRRLDMKFFSLPFVLAAAFFLTACTNTNVVLLDESKKYAPSQSVQILDRPPEQPYEVIAQLETRGAVGKTRPELLQSMREEAKGIGADAIIPTEEGREQLQQGIIFNPWLGGYQTIGGGQVPILRGYAIIFESSKAERATTYRPRRTFGFGVSIDAAAFALSGYGAGAWVGKNRFRLFGEVYSLETPSVFLRDGFEDGEIEIAYKLDGDYFFFDDLNGLFFTAGFEYTQNSVGLQGTSARGSYDALWISTGIGYLWRIARYIHFDARLLLDARLTGEEEVRVGNGLFVPDRAAPSGFIGIGINF